MYTVYLIVCKVLRHVYIGFSGNPSHRFLQHASGNGAVFTKIYGAKSFYSIKQVNTVEEAKREEQKLVNRLRKLDNFVIAGGGYTQSPHGLEETAMRMFSGC